MISEDLKEEWRLAARNASETPAVIKEMNLQPPIFKIGGTREPRNPIYQNPHKVLQIQEKRFVTKITNLVKEFNLRDEDILSANLKSDSDSAFVQYLYKHMKPDQDVLRRIVAKSLLIGIQDIQNNKKPV